MKRRHPIRLAALAFALIVSGLIMSYRHSPATLRERVDASIVRLSTAHEGCTGFVIAQDTVLTAAHCVSDEPTFLDGTEGTLLGHDEYYDLAVYHAHTGHKQALPLRVAPVVVDEPLFAAGYAFSWTQPIMTHNTVLLITQKGPVHNVRGIMYQGLIVRGMSGGPLVDAQGAVVGMVQQGYDGVAYSVNVQTMRAFLLDAGVE